MNASADTCLRQGSMHPRHKSWRNLDGVRRALGHFFQENATLFDSAAFVGSASAQAAEPDCAGSDLDCLVLLKDGADRQAFVPRLAKDVLRLPECCTLVDSWMVVSPQSIGTPVIHLHLTTTSRFQERSSLFRRAVAKYPAVVGSPLSAYSPSTPPTKDELVQDERGPVAYLRGLQDRSFFSGTAVAWPSVERVADELDYLLHGTLHSARNILRYMNGYSEFSPLSALPTFWREAGCPAENPLAQLVAIKASRRKYLTTEHTLPAAQRCAREFLQTVCSWMGASL